MKKTRGFSLIEILVVIAIIGILSGIIIVATNYFRTRSQDESRKADLKKLGVSLVLSRTDDETDKYPISNNAGAYNVKECLSQGSPTGIEIAKTMSTIPVDNYSTGKCYYYKSILDGQAFELSFEEKSTGNNYIIFGIADCTKWDTVYPAGKPDGEEIASGVQDCEIAGEITPPPDTELLVTPAVYATINGPEATSLIGGYFTRISDQDNDGKDDLLVGAPMASPSGKSEAGSVFLYYSSDKFGSIQRQWDGINAGDYFGRSVSLAGDQDGDGKEDFITIASGANGRLGAAYIYGSANNFATIYKTIEGIDTVLGISDVDLINDQNGDGKMDFLITARRFSDFYQVHGNAYIYTADGVQIHKFDGGQNPTSTYYNVYAKAISDQDGDGKDEVLFMNQYQTVNGVDYAGAAYLYSSRDWSLIKEYKGAEDKDLVGASATSINDNDGDGKADILIGGVWDWKNDNPLLPGLAHLFGRDGAITKTWSATDKYFWGLGVTTIPDQDGDGKNDILMGRVRTEVNWESAPALTGYGKVYTYSSKNNWDPLKEITAGSATKLDQFGYKVGWIGDQNGDGYTEIVVGAQSQNTPEFGFAGAIYIYSLHRE